MVSRKNTRVHGHHRNLRNLRVTDSVVACEAVVQPDGYRVHGTGASMGSVTGDNNLPILDHQMSSSKSQTDISTAEKRWAIVKLIQAPTRTTVTGGVGGRYK